MTTQQVNDLATERLEDLQNQAVEGHLDRWSEMPIEFLIHEFAVVRGDLSEPYARRQLVDLLERKVQRASDSAKAWRQRSERHEKREREIRETAAQLIKDGVTAFALHGPNPGHTHRTFLPNGGQIVRMACRVCNDAYPCATALALGAGRQKNHPITVPDYPIGSGWLYCTTCGRGIYMQGFPDQLGPWVHVGEEDGQ